MPLAFLLGVSWEDASLVAEMVGIKFFLNEFVAYQQLSTYKNNRLTGLPEWDGSQKQWISVSTLVITLYGNESLWALLFLLRAHLPYYPNLLDLVGAISETKSWTLACLACG